MQADRAAGSARRAIADAYPAAAVHPVAGLPQWTRLVHKLPEPALVSVMLRGEGALPASSGHPRIELLRDEPTEAAGEVLLFLAPNLTAGDPDWLRELVSQAMRPEIGAAGARLDGPDGRVVQSGLILDPDSIARTLAPLSDADDPGYFGQFRLARSVSAVSADCLAVRRDVFLDAGGFDPACGPYADVDLCLRLGARGLRCVWTPHARLAYTRRPRAVRDTDAACLMRARWGSVLANDPYFNPNLTVRHGNLDLRESSAVAHRILRR